MSRKLPRHLAVHGDAWKYQRFIPAKLRPMLGGRTNIVRYIPSMSEREAGKLAAAYGVQDDALFSRLQGMALADQTELAALGGTDVAQGIAASLPALRFAAALPKPRPQEIVDYYAKHQPGGRAAMALRTAGDAALMMDDVRRDRDATIALAERAESLVIKAASVASNFGFSGLLQVYCDRVQPTRSDNHQRTVRELTATLGNMDYRTVTGDDIAKFRDTLGKKGKGYTWENDHLVRTSAMFTAAITARAYKHRNPCDGIKPLSREDDEDKVEKASFTGSQARTILKSAVKVRFGDTAKEKRHDEALWVLLGLTFSGARPEEILLLQRGDVTKVDGVPVIEVRRTCCVTGERLKHKSIKNRSSRRTIPMHPALWDAAYQRKNGLPVASLLDFAKGDAAQFLFECFPWNATKYRRGWFDGKFSRFLLNDCGIIPGVGEKLSLSSLRNRFHDVMEHAGIGGLHERLIAGRAAPDVHEAYKRGKNLKLLAAAMTKVNPLSDD